MAVFYLTARLCNILHAAGAELVGLRIGCRLVVAALVLCREHLFVVADDVVLQFAHCLEFHPRHLGKCCGGLVQRVFGRRLQRIAVLVEVRAEHGNGRNLGKGVYEGGAETWQHIEVARARLDKREQAAAVDTLATGKDGVQIGQVVDDEVQCLQFSVASWIHEVHHVYVVLHHIVDDVGLREVACWLLQFHDKRIGIQNKMFVVNHFLVIVLVLQ